MVQSFEVNVQGPRKCRIWNLDIESLFLKADFSGQTSQVITSSTVDVSNPLVETSESLTKTFKKLRSSKQQDHPRQFLNNLSISLKLYHVFAGPPVVHSTVVGL